MSTPAPIRFLSGPRRAFALATRRFAHAALVGATLVATALAPSARAQGSLTPPGAPAPTMKTLAQIEPRTPLVAGAPGVTVNANGGFTLTVRGSYYLTGDLVVATGQGILIDASDVTLDLGGFSIRSAAMGVIGSGIATSFGQDRITIRHGSIVGQGSVNTSTAPDTFTDLGFETAVSASTCEQVLVEDLHVTGTRHGIYLAQGSCLVRRCTATRHSGKGIVATQVESCVVRLVGDTGITAQNAIGCVGEAQTGYGITATNVVQCYGASYNGRGINGIQVSDCYGYSNSGYGVFGETVSNSHGIGVLATGLRAHNASNCYGFSDSGWGIIATLASHCSGVSISGSGLLATTAAHSRGTCDTGTYGLTATQAENCYGYNHSGSFGLLSMNAINCIGENTAGTYGLKADGTAAYCRGISGSALTGLSTSLAIGCTYNGTIQYSYKYLMP